MNACYLCESVNADIRHKGVRDNPEINVLQCRDCGLVYLDSFSQITQDFYQSSGMHSNEKYTIDEWRTEAAPDDERRFELLKEKVAGKDILDFGCGAAGFLTLCNEVAKKAIGVELEERVIRFWRGELEIYNTIPDNRLFDVITSFHVFEHLKDPIEKLIKIRSSLKENGFVVIEVPNSDDALLTLYDCDAFKAFSYWGQHLYLYNANNLKDLAKRAGFKNIVIKYIQRYPLANHLYWLAHGKPGGHSKWEFANRPNLNMEYEKYLARIGMTDTLMMFAST